MLGPDLTLGLLFLCVLPSTVQSSIAFTSIAGGNVPAAICGPRSPTWWGGADAVLVTRLLHQDGGGISLDAMEKIALQILLPFLVVGRSRGHGSIGQAP